MLAELVCSPDYGAFFEENYKNSQAKTLSKIKAGGMTREHALIFQGDQARINIKERINDRIVNNIRYGKRNLLVDELSNLILADTTIDYDAKIELLSNADKEKLVDYLTDILLFLVNSTSFDTNTQLKNVQPAAITVLASEVVPELFKTMVAYSFTGLEDEPEAIEALRRNDFPGFLKSLALNKKISPREYRQWMNIIRIVGLAGEEIKKDGKKADNEYIPEEHNVDWFLEFFERAGKVSNSDLQELWAKVLAGEILRPSVVSPATLQVLLNLSPEEAKQLIRLSDNTFEEFKGYGPPLYFLSDFVNADTYDDDRHVFYADTRPLSEAGLVTAPETIAVDNLVCYLDLCKYALLLVPRKNGGNSFSFTREVLTKAGRELVSTLGSKMPKGFESMAVKYRKELSNNYKVRLHRVRYDDKSREWKFYTSTVEEREFYYDHYDNGYPDLTDYFEISFAVTDLLECCSKFQDLYLVRITEKYPIREEDIQDFIEYLPEGLIRVSPSIVELYRKMLIDHPEFVRNLLTYRHQPYLSYEPEEFQEYCVKMLNTIPAYQEISLFLKRVEEYEENLHDSHEEQESDSVKSLDL